MIDDTKKKHEEENIDEVEDVDSVKQNSGEEKIDGQSEQIEKLTAEVQLHKERYMRVLADYQNLEKRVQDQRKELFANASRDILLRILPILDTLQMAQKHSEDKSLSAAVSQFLSVLGSEQVNKIETIGKEFDPVTMECLTTQAGKENTVLEELRAGYMLGDKLLRSAQVIVGSAEQNSEDKN